MEKISKRIAASCGIVVVRLESEPLFLLLRAYDYWDFPKGQQEPGESYMETALRETAEETELGPSDLYFNWGEVNKSTEAYSKGKKYARYFIAETTVADIALPVSEELGYPEHDEFIWANYDEARKLVRSRVAHILDWANEVVSK